MTGIPFLIIFVLAIIVIIVMISKYKIHPFLSIMLVSLLPGLIAAANTLGVGDSQLLVMGLGALVSIPVLIGAYFYAKYIGGKIKAKDEAEFDSETVKSYEELVASYGTLPNGFMSLAPIIIPIILMAMSNVASILKWEGVLYVLFTFLGTPIIALAVGPFLLAAILKSAQGSSTVAITTTAGIMAPLMGALGMGSTAMSVLCVMAIGAGAMTVSHANDSYFWVVTNFGEMTPEEGYKTQTVVTLVESLCSMVGIFILSLILH